MGGLILEIDGDRLPATQLEHAATTPSRSGRFLVLEAVELHKNNARVTCVVRLNRRGLSFRGEAGELDTPMGRIRAAARATLAAASQVVDEVSFGLEGAACTELFSRRYVVVSIEAARLRRFAMLSGIIGLDSDHSAEEAAALAVLRAIERWIS